VTPQTSILINIHAVCDGVTPFFTPQGEGGETSEGTMTSRVGAGLPTGVGFDLRQHQNLWRCLVLFGAIWTSIIFAKVDSSGERALEA
jgi:hypothetical protein